MSCYGWLLNQMTNSLLFKSLTRLASTKHTLCEIAFVQRAIVWINLANYSDLSTLLELETHNNLFMKGAGF